MLPYAVSRAHDRTPHVVYLHFILVKLPPSNLAEVDFNVSGMFAMPAPTSNHVDYDCGTIERKRPQSMVGTDSDVARKDK